jgi:hypothetical protein
MAFDVTFPVPETKIRNLSGGIPDNWLAIEKGEATFKPIATNYDNRTLLTESNDPDPVDDTVILYCKEDDDDIKQLYVEDDRGAADSIQQLTFFGNNTISANGITYLPGGAILQWFTVSVGGGSTEITFPTEFPTACFNINITSQIASTSNDDVDIYIQTVPAIAKDKFTIHNSTLVTNILHVQAIGN